MSINSIALSLICGILLGLGVYFIALYVLKLPTSKTQSVLEKTATLDSLKNQTLVNRILGRVSKLLLPIIKLNESTEYRLQNALDYLHYNVTAKQHFADALSAGIVFAIISLFLFFISPFLGLIGIICSFLFFKIEYDEPIKKMEQIKEDIEYDSALFCKFIADELKENNRNVVQILTVSKESMSKSFKRELELTITEMKTSNQEDAIINMGRRINTSTMTQIVVGLLAVLNGNNQTAYFEMLYDKLYKQELTVIKKKNSVKPGKISKLSIILLIAIISQVLVGMFLSLFEELSSFGL